MKVVFRNDKLQKGYEDYRKLTQRYGTEQSKKIIARLNELISAKNLYDISKLPQARLHQLTGKYEGSLAVDLKQPYRLILQPLNGTLTNLESITEIKVIEVTDYH